MSSKASGEPSMMLSVSVLYALRRAVAAARNSLFDAYPTAVLPRAMSTLQHAQATDNTASKGDSPAAHSSEETQDIPEQQADVQCTSRIIAGSYQEEGECKQASQGEGRCRGNSFLVLEAPVTTAHLKEAVGQFDIAEMLRAAAGKGSIKDREPEYHSSGEWVFVH